MTYKQICLAIVALSAIAIVGHRSTAAGAQTGDGGAVLVAGQPPLTERMVGRMIDFFEWALDGKFTPSQRAQFQRERVVEWRNRQRNDIESASKIVAMQEQLSALSPEKRGALQGAAQAELLQALRRQPEDELSKLLLAVYESGEKPEPDGVVFPSTLAGEWASNSGSTVNYVNPNTGSYSAPSGDRFHYRFFPDGRYIEAGLMQSSLYGCTMKVSGYKTGSYAVKGSTLTLDEKSYTFTSQDNCRREWNYVKHPPVSKQTYQWRLEQGPDGPKLVMTGGGKTYAYGRVKVGNEILK